MEAAPSSEMSALTYVSTGCKNPDEYILKKSDKNLFVFALIVEFRSFHTSMFVKKAVGHSYKHADILK
jgi:hypothetical protein